jgi:UDP:flavonoid glycosyltransferase YjiC (YdhE family)
MKISLLTIGTRGDIQPFIALGTGLQQIGYQVEIVTHAIFESWIRSYGFDLGVGTEPILQSQLTVDKLTAAINQAVKDGQMQTSAQQVGNQIRSEDGVKKAVTIISSVVNRQTTRQDKI